MSSDRDGDRDDADGRVRSVARAAFLRGIFDGLGGPALIGTEPDLRLLKRWLTKKRRSQEPDLSSYNELLEKVTQEICREILSSADRTVERHGLRYVKVFENRLDHKGKLRQKERVAVREPIRSKHGEEG
jgi:hypothetical protein